MVLLLDNYDSFTYNLYDYILQCGQKCRVVRNDELSLEEIAALKFTCAVISPGPKTPGEAGITKAFISRYYKTLPILGICLGHQAIGEFFGAQLIPAARPMHGKTSCINHTGHYIFNAMPPQLQVMRYHSLILAGVEQTELNIIAQTATGEVMGIAHPHYPVVGLQFHPESILTPTGLQMLRNWFSGVA
jgi:anthranilate synthase/aminodeoxychorismate synthase-like glutamine amidotransferase